MSRLGAVGLYGKIAAQPDFLRAGAGAFSKAGLDRWFQDGMEMLRAERTALPPAATSFMLAAPDGAAAFVGVFTPSADAAGRSFPLAIFGEADVRDFVEAFPAWPAAHAPFLESAALLAVTGATASADDLAARAQALASAPPGAAASWEDEPVAALLASVDGSAGGVAYALQTLLGATESARSGPANKNNATLDVPAPTAPLRAFWLELIHRRLGWRDAAPSVLWTEGADGRTLVSLGPPAAGVLAYLANPAHRSPRLWPLRTSVASAREQALGALTAAQRRVLETPTAPLRDLIAVLA